MELRQSILTIIQLFTFAGAGMNAIHVAKNNGYRERYATDQWEQQSE